MRLTWIAATIIVASSSAQANTELEQQLSSCAVKTDKLERLVCYDDVVAKVTLATKNSHAVAIAVPAAAASQSAVTTTAPIIAPTSQVDAPIAATTSSVPVDAFGFRKTIEEDIEKLYFKIAKISKDPYGALIVTLTNGQIWKQTDSEHYRVNKGQTIYIEKGALSSFLLGTDDRNSTTRVKRIK